MAGKSKKHGVANPVSLGTGVKAPREVAQRGPPTDEERAPLTGALVVAPRGLPVG